MITYHKPSFDDPERIRRDSAAHTRDHSRNDVYAPWVVLTMMRVSFRLRSGVYSRFALAVRRRGGMSRGRFGCIVVCTQEGLCPIVNSEVYRPGRKIAEHCGTQPTIESSDA
jgi:hypothetical protein